MLELCNARRLEFDAGHRIQQHESKCRHLHGHRYIVEFDMYADELDNAGRVVDFGAAKYIIEPWLDTMFDHAMILQDTDPWVPTIESLNTNLTLVDFPPTAENLARFMGQEFNKLFARDGDMRRATVVRVRLWETPNCSATWINPDMVT